MAKTHPRRIQVVLAVIERRGRYLICQRRSGDDLGGYWELPGGKRLVGETWESCLRREVREELGVSVRLLRRLGAMRYRYPEKLVSFQVFRCAISQGEPRPLAARTLRWVRPGGLSRYRFPPANRLLVGRLSALRPFVDVV